MATNIIVHRTIYLLALKFFFFFQVIKFECTSMWFDPIVGELNNQVMINYPSNHVDHSFISKYYFNNNNNILYFIC